MVCLEFQIDAVHAPAGLMSQIKYNALSLTFNTTIHAIAKILSNSRLYS